MLYRSSALSLFAVAAVLAHPAAAQPVAEEAAPAAAQPTDATEIVVQAQIGYRNRDEDNAEPVLVYDTDYFQRFEPLTAGDALKRVPSVTFLSDVIESDGARLRGLPPGYTQILINGEKVPGSNDDRSFFLDRIPAELIERVEIVRSSSARRTGDAVAGSINIELRDALQLDGGYIKAGGLYFDDEEIEPSLGLVYGGALGPGRVLLGANLQGRHNPKLKSSLRYGDSPENNPNYAFDDFDNREDQTDTRDGKDYSFNGSYVIDSEATEFVLNGFYVRTDRVEDERSYEYNAVSGTPGPVPNGTGAVAGLLTDNVNVADIDQTSFSIDGKLAHSWALGKTTFKLGYAKFDEERFETEYEIDFNRTTPRFTPDTTLTDIVDDELSWRLDHEFGLGDGIDLVVGGFLQNKSRDFNLTTARARRNLTNADRTGYNQFTDTPARFFTTAGTFGPEPGSITTIEERRRDVFALIEGERGSIRFEAGLRYETTDLSVEDFTVPAANRLTSNDYEKLLPSASIKIDLTAVDRITASVARTSRRPEFNFISPARLLAELGDNDLQGNPLLAPETAWGGDLGYERRIGGSGIVGVNVFYREVTDLIELTTIGTGSEGAGTFVLQPRNVGNGKVYGIEFDLSTDLGFIGLRDTGIFGNFSYLDSEITDFAGTRRFNDQSEYVFNVGLIQNLPSLGAAFGATYRKQGDAFGRVVGEEITTSYGGDLEVFVEKRFGNSFTIRAVGSNLLDGSKDEIFNKFATIDDQLNRDFDEYELETETAGPVFQVVARYAF